MPKPLGIAIAGYGYWGPNLVRNFESLPGCRVVEIIDARAERRELAALKHSGAHTVDNLADALDNPEVDALVIATPVFMHYDMAKAAIEKGKHVLIEKPMTQSVAEAKELIALAKEKGVLLMVDHTFLYTGAVRKISSLIESGEIGDLQYFDSARVNLGLFQSDINVLWDLAPHDISILLYLVSQRPYSVCATGISHTFNGLENIAYLTINYPSAFIAHLSCSWSSPVKLRNILIGGSNKMVLFNDVEPTEKVKVYDTGFSVKGDEDKRKLLVDYRVGDIYVPKLEQKEALAGMAADFISGILEGTEPISNSRIGMEVVMILEAAQESIRSKGREVVLNWEN